MAKSAVATLAVAGGVMGALVVAATVAAGCNSDNSNGTPAGTTTHTATTTNTGNTGTTSSSTSTTATGDGGVHDAAPEADATVIPPCDTAAILNIDASDLLFSFDNGNISSTIPGTSGSWTATAASNPLDASFAVTAQGNPSVGNSCPGSLEVTVPFSTTSQEAITQFSFPSGGTLYNAKAIHIALRMVFPDDTDGSAAFQQELVIFNGAGYSFYQAFAQWTPAGPDGGASGPPGYSYVSTPHGYNDFPSDGGWLQVTVPILQTDPGDGAVTQVASDTPILLTAVGAQFTDPEALPDSSPGPLPFPLNTQFFVDDVWVE